MNEAGIPVAEISSMRSVEQASRHSNSTGSGHRPSPLRFVGHVGEMMVAMMVGMMVGHGIAVAVSGGLTISEIVTRYPVLSVVTMAVSMTVPMVAWMRFRGHSTRCSLEMAASMVVPAVPFIALYWLGVVAAPGRPYMSVSTLTMIAYMVYRRREYGL